MLEKNCFFLILLFVLSYLFPSTGLSQVNNKAQWDAAFDEMYGDAEPMLDITNANEDGGLAWEASYWLRAYISMAQTFGDSKYLDRAVRLIEFLLANRDDARLARGELNLQKQPYHTAPLPYLNNRQQAAPGWRHWDSHYKGWRVLLIDDAMITGAIMRFVALVYERDSFTGYRPKADDYIAKVEETVRAHDDSFVFNRFENIPGNYYYPAPDGSGLHTGAVEFNMSAAMGTTLLLLDKVRGGVEGNQRKALAILDYFKHHAHIDLGFFVLAHRRGLAFSKADMQRFAATLTKNVYRGNGELSWSVDGKETNVEKITGQQDSTGSIWRHSMRRCWRLPGKSTQSTIRRRPGRARFSAGRKSCAGRKSWQKTISLHLCRQKICGCFWKDTNEEVEFLERDRRKLMSGQRITMRTYRFSSGKSFLNFSPFLFAREKLYLRIQANRL